MIHCISTEACVNKKPVMTSTAIKLTQPLFFFIKKLCDDLV